MKVTTTTLPRRSAKPTRAPSRRVRSKSGAGPIRESRALAFAGWAPTGAPPSRSAPPISAIRNCEYPRRTSDLHRGRRRLCLQLLLQLVEGAPIGASGEDLLRARLDHPRLMEPERVEAHRIGRVVLPPPGVGDLLQGLQRIGVVPHKAPVYERPSDPIRLEGAHVGCLREGAQYSLGGRRVLLGEIHIRRRHAAEILRPGTIISGAYYHMTDFSGPELLGIGREAQQPIDLPVGKQLDRLLWRRLDELGIPARVETDIGGHGGHERSAPSPANRDGAILEIEKRAHSIGCE